MSPSNNLFSALADQMVHGNLAARAKLQHQLEHEMVYIVRRALRDRETKTTLGRRIFTEARRLGLAILDDSSTDRERIIREVAHSLCHRVIARIKPAPDEDGERVMQETFCYAANMETVHSS